MAKEILKEAIADAKAVREVALENAKMALEEAFDSKIKNMLSAKLAEELEEDVELEEEYIEEEAEATDEGYGSKKYMEDDDDVKKEEVELEEELEEDLDEEINLDELMAELEEMSYEEDAEEDVKEEAELEEGEDQLEEEAEPVDENVKDAMDAIKKAAKEAGKTVVDYLVGNKFIDSGITTTKRESVDFDIDSLVSEIEAELEEGKKKVEKEDDEKKKMKEDLNEALETVDSLKSTISEMNLLNSKLLYCNKLFRANSLTEAQKVKVVDALDKASTAGEAKLVFETLQESFNFTGVEKRAIKEGLARASKPVGTAPKKVLAESVDETVSRFQKLANINK